MIREDFELNIKKTPDKVEISTSGDEAGEVFDFARAILGDDFEAFDQDFPDAVEVENTELAPAEFDYDFDEDQLDVDHDVDPDQAFSDIEFRGPRTEDEIENDEISSDEEEVTDIVPASQPDDDEIIKPKDIVPEAEKALIDTIEQTPADESPKDMINGKLVDAKNPTESEVEIENDDEDDEEDVDEGLLGAAALGGLAVGAANAIGNKILNSSLKEDAVEEDYTGTPEERTTHLEYTDDNVTDGKVKLPKNITKSEDDHCTKVNKGINHDIDPKEKAIGDKILNNSLNKKKGTKKMNEFLDGLGSNLGEEFSKSTLLTDTAWAGVTHPFRGRDIDPELLGESVDDKDLSECFDVNLDAHDLGGTGNKVSVLGGPNPFSEALEDEPGYDELLQYIHNRRAKKRKNESLEKDMSDEEFVEAFGQELVKNNIKPKKVCKGKNCKVLEDLNGYDEEDFGIDTVEEGWSEFYDEDGMDNYDFSDIDVDDFDDETNSSAEDVAHEIDQPADDTDNWD